MKKYGPVIAVAFLLLVNAFVLAGAAFNRSGVPDAAVLLTERELPGAYPLYYNRENSGVSLRLTWSHYGYFWNRYPLIDFEWFDQRKLEAIGFDCAVSPASTGAYEHYAKMLPRKAFAVLEYEGPAWERWRANGEQSIAEMEEDVKTRKKTETDLQNAKKWYEQEIKAGSRLFVVDAGNDPALLRKQYSDNHKYIITPAVVRIQHYAESRDPSGNKRPPRLMGSVSDILTDEIHVPRAKRAALDALVSKTGTTPDYSYLYSRDREPRYAVTLQYGRRYEPWIAEITPLPGEAAK